MHVDEQRSEGTIGSDHEFDTEVCYMLNDGRETEWITGNRFQYST
jgi:hypothetical protein